MTDFLCHATIRMRLHHKIVDILKATVSRSQASTIVDLCSGGGGLLAGIAVAVKALRPRVQVIGVESAATGNFAAALRAGAPVRRPRRANLRGRAR